MSACFLPKSGACLVSGMRSGELLLWCTKTCQVHLTIPAHSPGKSLPNPHSGKPMPTGVCALALFQTRSQLLTGGGDGAVMHWNIPEGPDEQLRSGLILAQVAKVQDPLARTPVGIRALDSNPLGGPEIVVGTIRWVHTPTHVIASSYIPLITYNRSIFIVSVYFCVDQV
jgi:hypothetical protein